MTTTRPESPEWLVERDRLIAERDAARRLARWLFERTAMDDAAARERLCRDHPWLPRGHPELP